MGDVYYDKYSANYMTIGQGSLIDAYRYYKSHDPYQVQKSVSDSV